MKSRSPNIADLRCPCDAKATLKVSSERLVCSDKNCRHHEFENGFHLVGDCPILISTLQCDTICDPNEISSRVARSSRKLSIIRRLMGSGSRLTEKNCKSFVDTVNKINERARVLVIGSGEPGFGTKSLWAKNGLDVYGVDIYISDTVSTVCDAHNLPFKDEFFDGVWIQAVLEHVVDPQRVVMEIRRVLKPEGLVYSEIPFMQQVHEGAYDFTRFTLSGHRFLFKYFESIEMGVLGGPSAALSWSFRYWVWSITRSKNIARMANLIISLLMKPFFYFESQQSKFDSYSGSFFFGRKSEIAIKHKDLLALYKGNIN